MDSVWHSRLHNAVYQSIRVNKIPCFGKTRRTGKKKGQLGTTAASKAAVVDEERVPADESP